uniref:Uncharacterized protein n=1 Tax=Megaselia scalaris TaxID=36166 RepID=T1GTU9_MEGSC
PQGTGKILPGKILPALSSFFLKESPNNNITSILKALFCWNQLHDKLHSVNGKYSWKTSSPLYKKCIVNEVKIKSITTIQQEILKTIMEVFRNPEIIFISLDVFCSLD